ncbi:MAG: YegS/Rv2252/BmrU family lipid kinase [Lachnospiraceae bacterium]|nr:YegS/Rv2252/BmrU family lipid kinase [Lachnospiraceae bacterium]
MQNLRLLFIYNGHAGNQKILSRLSEVVDIFVKAGFMVTVYPTQGQGDAIRAASENKDEFDRIVCCGGDGTLYEVVRGLYCNEMAGPEHVGGGDCAGGISVPIGYIPAGSTNDFANSLKLPKDIIEAAEVAVHGRSFLCDMGKFNEKPFVYVAAFGIFTDVSYETSQDMKNAIGHMAYLVEALKRLPQMRTYKVRVEYDDKVLEDEFIYGMVSNSISVGGIQKITGNDVYLDDGLFEVTLIKPPTDPLDFQEIGMAIVSGNEDIRVIKKFKTEKIRFFSKEPLSWTLDGEFGGSVKEAVLENVHHTLPLIVPKDQELPSLELIGNNQ